MKCRRKLFKRAKLRLYIKVIRSTATYGYRKNNWKNEEQNKKMLQNMFGEKNTAKDAKGANSQSGRESRKTEDEMDAKSRGGSKERKCKKLEKKAKNRRKWNTMSMILL